MSDILPKVIEMHRQRVDALGDFLNATERTDSISNYLSSLGNPGVDSGSSGRPSLATRLHPHELEVLYLQNDLGGIIVDEIVDEAFREGYRVAVDGDTETTDPAAEWTKRLLIPETVALGAKWGRLYGGGFVLMVLDDGLDPSVAVDLTKIQSVVNLVDLDRYEVTPARWDTDIRSSTFGEPDVYQVLPQTQGGTAEGLEGNLVHASRLLRFGGVALPRKMRSHNGGFDDSVLQRPWDAIRRFCETEQAMARIVQSFEVTTIAMAGLANIMQHEDGAGLIQARMALIAKGLSIINAYLLDADAGEQLTRQSSSVAGLPEIRQGFSESVSKAARMPQTILFGAAPAGLNTDGESGIQSWHKQVRAYQEKELTPELEKLYRCVFCAKDGPTKGVEPAGWRLEWYPLDEPGELEVANLRKIIAEIDSMYLDRGVRTAEQVARSRDGVGGWSMETVAAESEEALW